MVDQANPKNFARLASARFSVFSVPEGKKVPGPWKEYQTSRATPFEILEWSSSRLNIGIATGEISGCFVFDVDNPATLEWLYANRELPNTLTVSTPRGFHFYYRHPGGRVKNRTGLHQRDTSLPEGLDIRGDGGFAMGPGSYYVPTDVEREKGKVEGPYRFVEGSGLGEVEMADAPQWLLDVMHDEPYVEGERDDRPIPDAYVAKAVECEIDRIMTAPAGTRNDAVNRASFYLGQFVGAGVLEKGRAEADLLNAAQLVGQTSDEAKASVASGLKDGMKKPRRMPVRDDEVYVIPEAPAVSSDASSEPVKPFGHDAFKASEVAKIDAPAQEWVIEDFIPRGHVTTLFGDGGVGKTLLAQTMGSHIASGEPFADRDVMKLRVAAIMCEDDAAELNRRQRRINERLFDETEVEDFTILSRIGEDNVLGVIGSGKWEPTKLYREIEAWVEANQIQVLIVDNIMQVFGGDINDNQSVTWFVNSLTRLARKMNGAVILLGHIAKAENSRFSGSMAWNNSVRARLFLSKIEAQDGSGLELRQLTVDKSNYGKAGLSIDMAIFDGVLIDKRSVSKEEADLVGRRIQTAREAVKALIQKEESKSISMSHQSTSYLFTPERLFFLRRAGAAVEKDVKAAIAAMLADGTLSKESRVWSDTAKKKRERIVLTPRMEDAAYDAEKSVNMTREASPTGADAKARVLEIMNRKEAA